jgi:Holliday junction resolvase
MSQFIESTVFDYIKSTFATYYWIQKSITDENNYRSKDIYLDLGYQIIIIEINENQLEFSVDQCDYNRLMKFSKANSYKPIVLIRFNPDDYNNIESCWLYDENRNYIIDSNCQDDWNARLLLLQDTIHYWLQYDHKLESPIRIIRLFFDT